MDPQCSRSLHPAAEPRSTLGCWENPPFTPTSFSPLLSTNRSEGINQKGTAVHFGQGPIRTKQGFKAAGTEGTCPVASPSSAAAMREAWRWKGRQRLLRDQLVLERRSQLFSPQAPLQIHSKDSSGFRWFVLGTFVFKLCELASTHPCFCLQSGSRLAHSQTAAGPVGLALPSVGFKRLLTCVLLIFLVHQVVQEQEVLRRRGGQISSQTCLKGILQEKGKYKTCQVVVVFITGGPHSWNRASFMFGLYTLQNHGCLYCRTPPTK